MRSDNWIRRAERGEGKIHYEADGLSGNVTLCGIPDFIGRPGDGAESGMPVNCAGCLSIVRFVLENGVPHELDGELGR